MPEIKTTENVWMPDYRDMAGTFDKVADFVFALEPADIDARALDRAKLLMLDLVGVAAAAGFTPATKISADFAAISYGGDQAGLMFDDRRLSMAGAAFANGTRIDSLDGHDGFSPAKGHAGAAILPGLLAFAEQTKLTGREALTTFVLGYEVACRVALAQHDSVPDYHTSGSWNALGVVAMGARIRGLSREQFRHALGIAEYHGPRSQMMRCIDHPTMLHDGSGWGAMVGVTSTLLAEGGFTGAPAVTIEGAKVADWWADLGQNWFTIDQYVKPYPVCRWAHPMIDGVLQLYAQGIRADRVARMELVTFHESKRLGNRMPRDTAEAQYCLAFPVAAALVNGVLGVEQIHGEALKHPDVERLTLGCSIGERDVFNQRFPAGRWAEVILYLDDGTRVASGEINARGGPDNPLGAEEMVAKFHTLADPVIGERRAHEIENYVLGLDGDQERFAGLVGR